MAGWAIGLLAVNSAYYYFGEPFFFVFLPLYVFTIFGMLATLLSELFETLIEEIREKKSPQSPNKQ
jgi:ABC-type microcin C transport system permease subunit YejB